MMTQEEMNKVAQCVQAFEDVLGTISPNLRSVLAVSTNDLRDPVLVRWGPGNAFTLQEFTDQIAMLIVQMARHGVDPDELATFLAAVSIRSYVTATEGPKMESASPEEKQGAKVRALEAIEKAGKAFLEKGQG